MTLFRKALYNRLAMVYGITSPVTEQFKHLCATYPDGWRWDDCLEALVKAHETDVQTDYIRPAKFFLVEWIDVAGFEFEEICWDYDEALDLAGWLKGDEGIIDISITTYVRE